MPDPRLDPAIDSPEPRSVRRPHDARRAEELAVDAGPPVERTEQTVGETAERLASLDRDMSHMRVELRRAKQQLRTLEQSREELLRAVERSTRDLEMLQSRTAQVLTATLFELQVQGHACRGPLAGVAPEIRRLAELEGGTGRVEEIDDGAVADGDVLDLTSRHDLAVLDRKSRWRPFARQRAYPRM